MKGNEVKKTLILIRGLPGSGKSTLAKYLASSFEAPHYETDQFFEGPKGYNFDANLIKLAHEWCQAQVRLAFNLKLPIIIVSNTFSRSWEWQTYEAFADLNGYNIIIIETNYPGKSVHNVPSYVIENMLARWEKVDKTIYKYLRWDYNCLYENEKTLCQLLRK